MFAMAWEWDSVNWYQENYQHIHILCFFPDLYSGQVEMLLIRSTFIGNVVQLSLITMFVSLNSRGFGGILLSGFISSFCEFSMVSREKGRNRNTKLGKRLLDYEINLLQHYAIQLFKKCTHFSYKYWSSFCLHYFQWKTFSKSDRQEGSEPICKLNLNLFMFSLCIFVLVPKCPFSSNGCFLSLEFIFLLCLKTAILFLLILHFSNLMKQVLLFIFHEEKKYFLDHPFLYLFIFKFTDPFICSLYWWQSIFCGSSAERGESSYMLSLISYLYCLQVQVYLYFACRNK